MTPEQKKKIGALVQNIQQTAEDVGYYSDDRESVAKNDKAWQDFKTYLEGIDNETNA